MECLVSSTEDSHQSCINETIAPGILWITFLLMHVDDALFLITMHLHCRHGRT